MAKKFIKNGEKIFATGVFLMRDTSVKGGYVVVSFEDDSFFEGKYVNDVENEPYITEGDDDD